MTYSSKKFQSSWKLVIFLLLIIGIVSKAKSDDYDVEHKNEEEVEIRAVRDESELNSTRKINLTFPGCGIRFLGIKRKKRQIKLLKSDQLFSHQETREISHLESKNEKVEVQLDVRIIGGLPTKSNSWPWMAVIFRKQNRHTKHLCGASLISLKYVLTAAHCFDGGRRTPDPLDFLVVVGSHTKQDGIEYAVKDILIHPKYQRGQYYNDITLLKLEEEVELTNYIRPVCLPTDELKDEIDYNSANFTLTGWGNTKYGGYNSEVLLEVDLPTVTLEECKATYSQITARSIPKGITSEFLCAGFKEGGKDACQGDSGGPLTYKLDDERWIQVGIVSFGYQCAKPGFPGVYTRLSEYTQWLYENTDLGKQQ